MPTVITLKITPVQPPVGAIRESPLLAIFMIGGVGGKRHEVIGIKMGSGRPSVGATLVVARFLHQPFFVSLMWPDKAKVIPA